MSYAIELGDFAAALAPTRQAVALNPWSAAYRERLAYIYISQQDWRRALRESQEALRLNPFLHFPRMFVVQCLLHQHEPGEAETEFATLLNLNPDQRESLARWFTEQRRTVEP
jgi:tetratricopeptide (TPR) repeat protein